MFLTTLEISKQPFGQLRLGFLGILGVLMSVVRLLLRECLFANKPVFKRGQTTGTTAGYAERILADLRIDEWPTGMTHRAVLISNWPKSLPTDILNTSADHGDSGSWVLNNGGDLVGIVTSGSHSTDTVAYMMPFEIARLDMVNQFNKIAGTSFELDWPSSDI